MPSCCRGSTSSGRPCGPEGCPTGSSCPGPPGQHVPRLAALGKRAAAVVSDWFPAFIIPGHLRGAAKALEVPLVAVDASCVVPMQRIPEKQVGAYALRPKLRKLWPEYLGKLPRRPRAGPCPGRTGRSTWASPRRSSPGRLVGELDGFDIDHAVPPVPGRPGGRAAAVDALRVFVREQVARFEEARNEPGQHGQSGLSPALHFGLLFAGEVAQACIEAHGAEQPGVKSFLEELLVRRELGFNYCLHTPVHAQLAFTSLPRWAQETLTTHRKDRREHLYTLEQLDRGETADPLWNAAQRELREDGRIHGYLRMLWGKKILEWSPSPDEALAADRPSERPPRARRPGRGQRGELHVGPRSARPALPGTASHRQGSADELAPDRGKGRPGTLPGPLRWTRRSPGEAPEATQARSPRWLGRSLNDDGQDRLPRGAHPQPRRGEEAHGAPHRVLGQARDPVHAGPGTWRRSVAR